MTETQQPAAPESDTWKPPANAEEFNAIIEKRLNRERARFADYDDLKSKAERHDALELELSSDKDKAVAAAKKEAREAALAEATPKYVRAEFRAAAKGQLTPEQLTALLEDLDLSKYVTDKGEVDEDKISRKVAAFAPPKKETPPPNLGQGQRNGSQVTAREMGAAEAARRFNKK